MLHKIMVALAIAFALGGSALPTSAFALGGGGRMADGGYAFHGDRVSTLHRGLLHSHGRGYERDPWDRRGYGRDPWGHWGAYYGPMI